MLGAGCRLPAVRLGAVAAQLGAVPAQRATCFLPRCAVSTALLLPATPAIAVLLLPTLIPLLLSSAPLLQNMMEYHPESQEQLAWGSSAARSCA